MLTLRLRSHWSVGSSDSSDVQMGCSFELITLTLPSQPFGDHWSVRSRDTSVVRKNRFGKNRIGQL